MRSALRHNGSANSHNGERRSVEWREDVPAPDEFESSRPSDTESETESEADAHDRRTLEWDVMYDCLSRVCLTKDRWLSFIPEDIPSERRYLAPSQGEELWKRLAMDSWVPNEEGEASEGSVHNLMISLTLMSSMWDVIYNTIFGRLVKSHRDLNLPIIKDTETQEDWECLTTVLIDRYRMFERKPYDLIESPKYAAEVRKLAQSACELRALLFGEGDTHSSPYIYMPAQRKNQDLRYCLNGRTRTILNITDEDDEVADGKGIKPQDVIALVLCGGLMRRPPDQRQDDGFRIASTEVPGCERKAVVVTMRPEAGKSLRKVYQISD